MIIDRRGARLNHRHYSSPFTRERVKSVEVAAGLTMNTDFDILVGSSAGELEALSDSLLAPSAQARLDELLARNAQHQLEAAQQSELDRLLERVDQLTVLKTRARYPAAPPRRGFSAVSVYISADLQQKIRSRFSNRCAYCQTPSERSATPRGASSISDRVRPTHQPPLFEWRRSRR
jgi:hypothetical protein